MNISISFRGLFRLRNFALFSAAVFAQSVSASSTKTVTIQGSVTVAAQLAKLSTEPNIFKDCYITLENPSNKNQITHKTAFVSNTGEFQFHSIPLVPSESDLTFYNIEVNHPMYLFESFTVEVTGKETEPVRATYMDPIYGTESKELDQHFIGEYKEGSSSSDSKKKSSSQDTNPNTFTLPTARSTSIKLLFQEREQFDITSLFKNPMVLVTLGMMALMYCMPKPETLQEMKKDVEGLSLEKKEK